MSKGMAFLWAGLAMLNLASLAMWIVSVVTSTHHKALDFWLVVLLGGLLVTALVWGWKQRQGPPGGGDNATGGAGGAGPGGGGGGGAAIGPGAVAHGGEGGRPEQSAFEVVARASLGMGYPLDEFIRLAGFDPNGGELDRVGVGGDGGAVSVAAEPGHDGGDGLVVVVAMDDDQRHLQVDVFHAGGRHFIVQRRDRFASIAKQP